jgi:hypothetical protein
MGVGDEALVFGGPVGMGKKCVLELEFALLGGVHGGALL